MPLMMLQTIMRHQDLRDPQIEARKELLVGGHEAQLANRGAGLHFGKIGGPLVISEDTHARAHGSRTDEHDLFAGFAMYRELPDQSLHLGKIELLAAVGQDASPDLDHDAGHVLEQIAAIHGGSNLSKSADG